MITLERAKEMFTKMISESGKNYRIDIVWEIDDEEPIYAMMVIDEEGNQQLPGRLFPAIRKSDGELVDWEYPCPA